MKNYSTIGVNTKQQHLLLSRDVFLAGIFFFLFLLILFIMPHLQKQSSDGMMIERYGKTQMLKEIDNMDINIFSVLREYSGNIIQWEVTNQHEKGVYVVVRTANDKSDSYIHFRLVNKNNDEQKFMFTDKAGLCSSEYRIMFISKSNTYTTSNSMKQQFNNLPM